MTAAEQSVAVDAVRIPLDHSRDVSGLAELVTAGRVDPDKVIAVTGKTEGCTPGETSRVDADHAIREFLLDKGTRGAERIEQIPMVFTSGGVGILTPHIVVYTRYAAEPAPDARLTVGTARSAIMLPEWTGTTRVVAETAATVRAAAADAFIEPTDIEYVIAKAYHPTQRAIADARAAGHDIPDYDDGALFRATSGSAGLGIGSAIEDLVVPDPGDIGVRLDVWSGHASASANPWEPVGGDDGPRTQLIALGNRPGAGGRLRVGHAVIADLLDVEALPRALRRAGLHTGPGPLSPEQRQRVVAVYVKIGPPPDGRLRGHRQVTENPGYGNEVKAAVAGMYAAWLQDNMLYISGSATHQGPPGGGTLAVVVDVMP